MIYAVDILLVTFDILVIDIYIDIFGVTSWMVVIDIYNGYDLGTFGILVIGI